MPQQDLLWNINTDWRLLLYVPIKYMLPRYYSHALAINTLNIIIACFVFYFIYCLKGIYIKVCGIFIIWGKIVSNVRADIDIYRLDCILRGVFEDNWLSLGLVLRHQTVKNYLRIFLSTLNYHNLKHYWQKGCFLHC